MQDVSRAGARDQHATGAEGTLPVLPPRLALVELVLFALLIAAEWGIESFPDLSRTTPHAYWLPVLLLSLQYGTVSGLLAAALAVVGTLLIGMPGQEIGESYFVHLVRIWTQPVLWIVAALLVGSFRLRQIEQRDALVKATGDAIVEAKSLKQHADALRSRCEDLERALTIRAGTDASALLAIVGRLAQTNEPSRRSAFAEAAIQQAFPEAKASIAAVSPGGLEVVLTVGWAASSVHRTSWTATDPLTRAIVADRRTLSVLAAADERLLAGDGMAAVPIIAPHSDRVVGMLKLETLPAAALGSQTPLVLSALASHLWPLVSEGPAGALTTHEPGQAPPTGPVLIRRRANLQRPPQEAAE